MEVESNGRTFNEWLRRQLRVKKMSQRQLAMQAGVKSEIPNLWITPSLYLSEEHWKILADVWSRPK